MTGNEVGYHIFDIGKETIEELVCDLVQVQYLQIGHGEETRRFGDNGLDPLGAQEEGLTTEKG